MRTFYYAIDERDEMEGAFKLVLEYIRVRKKIEGHPCDQRERKRSE